jgi:DNA gyrase subunit A
VTRSAWRSSGPGQNLTVTENGYGRTAVEDYRITARGGKGIINIRVNAKNGPALAVKSVAEDDQIFVITQSGMILRIGVKGISVYGRATQGVRLMSLEPGDRLVAVAQVPREERSDEAPPVLAPPRSRTTSRRWMSRSPRWKRTPG